MVTDADNAALSRFPTLEEVHEVVNQMDHSSAPGPDGFNGKFYSTCWDIIGQDLHQAVLSFFNGREIPKAWSSTAIVLLPKVKNP